MGFWIGKMTENGYQSPLIYRWFKPPISGNSINGLDEEEFRQPKPLLWHRLKFIRYKLIQLLFQSRFRPRLLLFHQHIAKHFIQLKKRKKILRNTHPNSVIQDLGPNATTIIKDLCVNLGADTVGITKMDSKWIFEGYQLPAWAKSAMDEDKLFLIIMAVQHDKACFQSAPGWDFSHEIANQYNQGSDIAVQVAHWVLDKGYHAYGHGGPEAGEFTLTPAAIQAGIGELGKHGSLINPKLGANFRIACVYTTLELTLDRAPDFGIDDFCLRCQICTKACPPQAISDGKKMVRGVEKFYVDFDKCMPYMTDHYGCGICLKECPWSNENIVEKVYRKQQKRVFNNSIDSNIIAVDQTIHQISNSENSM